MENSNFIEEIKKDFYEYSRINEEFFNKFSQVGVAGEEWNKLQLDNKNTEESFFYYLSSPLYFLGIVRLQFKRKEFRLEIYNEHPKGSILDFGAGLGGEDFYLASKGADVTYYEPNALARDFMRFRLEKHNVKLKILEPWQYISDEKKYDTIFCFDVFDHVPNWREMIPIFKNKLTPTGKLIHQTEFGFNSEECPYHFEDSVDELNKELEKAGIKYTHIKY